MFSYMFSCYPGEKCKKICNKKKNLRKIFIAVRSSCKREEKKRRGKKIVNKEDVFSCTSCLMECFVSQLGNVENAKRMKDVPPRRRGPYVSTTCCQPPE